MEPHSSQRQWAQWEKRKEQQPPEWARQESDTLNPLVLLPIALLVVPLIPSLLEIFRRKDKGPRKVPEQTTYEEKPDLELTSVPKTEQDASHVPGEKKTEKEAAPMLERARGEARIKVAGEVIRVVGDISIPDGMEVNNHLVIQGTLRMGKKCHIHGSVKAYGSVEVGESSTIDGHILSEGKMVIGRNSRVSGIVDSAQDIILKENAVVEAVSTEKKVILEPGAKINRRILSGMSIVVFPVEGSKTVTFQPPEVEISRRIEELQLPKPLVVPSVPTKVLDENKVAEEIEVGKTIQTEDKVLELASRGNDVEEIGLRLLMDPSEVQRILKSLVEKGYLSQDLKLKKKESEETLRSKPAFGETETKEKPLIFAGEPSVDQIEDLFERLLASKMRHDLKEKISGEGEERQQTADESEKTSRSDK